MIDPEIHKYLERFEGRWELKDGHWCDACEGKDYNLWEITESCPWLCEEHARELHLLW